MKTITKHLLFAPTVLLLTFNAHAQNISTIAGTGVAGYGGNGGPATSAQLHYPDLLTFNSSDNLFIGDNNNNVIRKVTPAGIISTVAGNGVQGFSGDGGQATAAEFHYPAKVGFDATGNMIVVDQKNNRVRKVNTSGIVTTIAGNGIPALSGDGGPATSAELNGPIGVVVDAAGNYYITDTKNYEVRKINTSGVISSYAGNGTAGYSGDGGAATSAELSGPIGISMDAAGNLYMADAYSNAIRKVNHSSGIISTVAGNGTQGYSGNGGQATAAELYNPSDVFVDAFDNIYIADYGNNMIRKVNATSGKISTIAGNGVLGFSGDGGPATSAEFNVPTAVAISASGNIYVADQQNNRVRKINALTGILEIADNNSISIYPNPANNKISFSTSNIDGKTQIAIMDLTGKILSTKTKDLKPGEVCNIDVSGYSSGIYFIRIINHNNSYSGKFIKE